MPKRSKEVFHTLTNNKKVKSKHLTDVSLSPIRKKKTNGNIKHITDASLSPIPKKKTNGRSKLLHMQVSPTLKKRTNITHKNNHKEQPIALVSKEKSLSDFFSNKNYPFKQDLLNLVLQKRTKNNTHSPPSPFEKALVVDTPNEEVSFTPPVRKHKKK